MIANCCKSNPGIFCFVWITSKVGFFLQSLDVINSSKWGRQIVNLLGAVSLILDWLLDLGLSRNPLDKIIEQLFFCVVLVEPSRLLPSKSFEGTPVGWLVVSVGQRHNTTTSSKASRRNMKKQKEVRKQPDQLTIHRFAAGLPHAWFGSCGCGPCHSLDGASGTFPLSSLKLVRWHTPLLH